MGAATDRLPAGAQGDAAREGPWWSGRTTGAHLCDPANAASPGEIAALHSPPRLSTTQVDQIMAIHPQPPVLAFDGDDAGQRAASRAATAFALCGRESVVVTFPPRNDGEGWRDDNVRPGRLKAAPSTFATKAEATRWLPLVEADIARGEFIDPHAGQVTVSAWAEKWLASPGNRAASIARDRQGMEVFIRELGQIRLSSLTTGMVQSGVDARARVAGPATLARDFAAFRALVNAAVDAHMIGRSPVRKAIPGGHAGMESRNGTAVKRPHRGKKTPFRSPMYLGVNSRLWECHEKNLIGSCRPPERALHPISHHGGRGA
jgi:hypothetical protein